MLKTRVRQMREDDYVGVRNVDELTQRQYLGPRWDQLSDVEKDTHLKSRPSEFEVNLKTGFCFVAIRDSRVIGFVLAYETRPFRGTVYIRHIAVHPECQGTGTGPMLYGAVIARAKQHGIKEIRTLINLDNPESIRLHEKTGFRLTDRKQAILFL